MDLLKTTVESLIRIILDTSDNLSERTNERNILLKRKKPYKFIVIQTTKKNPYYPVIVLKQNIKNI